VRMRSRKRAGLAGVLSLAVTGAAAVPAAAQTTPQGTPTATPATPAPTSAPAAATQARLPKTRIHVGHRRLHVKLRRSLRVRGAVRPRVRGARVLFQAHVRGRWKTLDRARTRARGRYVLSARPSAPVSAPVRLLVRRTAGSRPARRTLGRVNVYRVALASWYGPGFYGNRTGCGGRLGYGSLGVAHKSLPCGTKVTFRHRGRSIRVPVIDRGPYVGAREYDLTARTARRIGFNGHGAILATR
jgi:rare lipoprotein A